MNAPFLSWLKNLTFTKSNTRRNDWRPHVELLEDRLTPTLLIVAPQGQAVGANHYASLLQALGAAHNGDTIEILPGAKLGSKATVYQSNLTITGLPSAGALGLQSTGATINNLVIIGNNDTITNMAVGTVAIGLGNVHETFSSDIFYGLGIIQTMGTGSSGLVNGFDTVVGSTFTNGANVTLGNTAGSAYDTASNDTISNNLFLNPVGIAITVSNETSNLLISGNRIYHNDPATGAAFIMATDCVGIITGNTLQLQAGLSSVGILVQDSGLVDPETTALAITNNVITTNETAIEIIHQSAFNTFTISIANNVVAESFVGLILQGNGGGGALDFGTLTITGNDFRGFTGLLGNDAIIASDQGSVYFGTSGANSSAINATGNIFSTLTPANVISTALAPGLAINVNNSLLGVRGALTAMFATLNAGAPSAALLAADSRFSTLALAKAAVTSTTAMSSWVEGLSVALYGRQLTAQELKGWVAELSGGILTEEKVIVDFVTSTEYYNKVTQGASNPNGTWVQSLYLNLLGRQPTGTELTAALTVIRKLGLASFATALVNSAEFRTDQVEAYYGFPAVGVIPTPNIVKLAVTPTALQISSLVNSKLDLFSIQETLLASTAYAAGG